MRLPPALVIVDVNDSIEYSYRHTTHIWEEIYSKSVVETKHDVWFLKHNH